MIFGAGFTHRLAQHFHTATGSSTRVQHRDFSSGNAHTEFSQEQIQSPRSLDQGVHAFLRTTQANGFRDNPDIRQGSYPFHAQGFGSEWRREPILGSVQHFYLHAPGLTLVTLGTACIPSVRLLPTTWKLTGPSKGLRIK
jgi:hypothetical protein